MSQASGATTRSMTPAGVMAITVAAVVLGFALGAVVGWPPVGGSATADGELALMCRTLDDVEPSFMQRLQNGEVDFMGRGDDAATMHLVVASVELAEAAAIAGDGDDDLQATARDLRGSLERLQAGAASDQLDRLRQSC